MTAKRLENIYRNYLTESEHVLCTFLNSAQSYIKCHHGTQQLAMEACVVRLHDSWARFCRELVFCSASGQWTTASGAVLKGINGITSRKDISLLLKAGFKANKKALPFGEPRWADSSQCMDAVKILMPANAPTILAAIGSTPSPADDLRRVRNYIAHRNENTANDLVPVTKGRLLNIKSLLSNPIPPTGTSTFEIWVLQLRTIAAAAIQ